MTASASRPSLAEAMRALDALVGPAEPFAPAYPAADPGGTSPPIRGESVAPAVAAAPAEPRAKGAPVAVVLLRRSLELAVVIGAGVFLWQLLSSPLSLYPETPRTGRTETSVALAPLPEDLSTRARNGDAEAQYALARQHLEGRGRAPDVRLAAMWMREAALNGDARAQLALGYMLSRGLGTEKDPLEAAIWFTNAAQQGQPEAQFELGEAYAEGRGVTRDAGAAAQWYRRAALLGRPEAQRRLAALLESGAGVAKDPVEARAWLEIASRSGDEDAKALLASREKTPVAVVARIEALEKEITPAPAGEGREILRLVERALATASGGTADGMRLPGIAQALAAVSGKTAPSERHAETAPTQHRADAAALPKGEPNADAVREIQRLLAIAHYDPGAATGVLNERTRAAIRRYQRTMGLPDDGLATPALLERLRKDASPLRPPGR